MAAKAGGVYASWDLAREYGFDDVDGRRPDWGAHIHRTVTDAIVGLARRGEIPDAAATEREKALERLRKSLTKALGKVGLAFYLDAKEESFYELALELGPEPEETAVADFVAKNLW